MKYLKTSELAERWNVSQGVVRRMVHNKDIPVTNFGNTWRFDIDDVERYEKEQKDTERT